MVFPKGNTFGTANKGQKRPGASEFWTKWNAEKHPLTESQIEARKRNVRLAIAARVNKCAHFISDIDPSTKIGLCRKCGKTPMKTAVHKSKHRQGVQYICWVGSMSPSGSFAHVAYPNQALDLWESQDGRCAICKRVLIRGGGLADDSATLDHCHDSGVIRSWLCQPCNKGIGHFKENADLMRCAIEYIESKCQIDDAQASIVEPEFKPSKF